MNLSRRTSAQVLFQGIRRQRWRNRGLLLSTFSTDKETRMLIAHLPSGYLLGAAVQETTRRDGRLLMAAALCGSMAPDLDMIYYHLIDAGRVHHHDYVTHWPLFWLAAGLGMAALVYLASKPQLLIAMSFIAGALLHMVLDTIAAPIRWLMPFSDNAFEIVTVPAAYSHWIISFTLHWTFALEMTICLAALVLFFWRRRHVKAI